MDSDDRTTHKIITWYADNAPCCQELLISLKPRDWCEFEKSNLFRELMKYLERLETHVG